MSEHPVVVEWARSGAPFGPRYNRDHTWRFPGGAVIAASSAPSLLGNPKLVDPEAAFVASISSCHMLWFLYLAAEDGYLVDDYRDSAVGHLERDTAGVSWITSVELDPTVSFSGHQVPSKEQVHDLHHRSHQACFIANSVRTTITMRAARSDDQVGLTAPTLD